MQGPTQYGGYLARSLGGWVAERLARWLRAWAARWLDGWIDVMRFDFESKGKEAKCKNARPNQIWWLPGQMAGWQGALPGGWLASWLRGYVAGWLASWVAGPLEAPPPPH